MLHHDTQTWIVFTLAGRELCRITAAEALADEPEETRALLAYENRCPLDYIELSLEDA